MIEYLEQNDVSIETSLTTDDFASLAKEVNKDLIQRMINTVMVAITGEAMVDGWKPGEEKLGRYVQMNIEGKMFHGDDSTYDRYDFADVEIVLTLLDKYGDAFAQNHDFPLLVLRDKTTGDLFEATDEQILGYFCRPDVKKFMEHVVVIKKNEE